MPDRIAKHCYSSKQHFATRVVETALMEKKSASKVLAENLDAWMKVRNLKQEALSSASGVGQTTISLYLRPEARTAGKSGNTSPKLSHIELLAEALGLEAWELLKPTTSARVEFAAKIEEAFTAFTKLDQAAQTVETKQTRLKPAA